jgi:acyl-CoA dehydrogenase
VEGTNILTRSLIIFGQGALRCHPHVLDELAAAHDPDPAVALVRFDRALLAHAGYLVRNLGRTLFLGLTRGRAARTPIAGETGVYARRLDWLSSAFALNADLAMMTLGGSLKRRERISARLGDLLSLLFLGSAVLKHYEDQGRPAGDLPLVRWALEDHLLGIQDAFLDLWRSLPNPLLARVLRRLVFPLGLPFRDPGDDLEHRVARLILERGASRDRLTEGIYRTRDPAQAVGRLELALEAVTRAADAERVLQAAAARGQVSGASGAEALRQAQEAGVLRADEAVAIQRAEHWREAAIAVDSFADP